MIWTNLVIYIVELNKFNMVKRELEEFGQQSKNLDNENGGF